MTSLLRDAREIFTLAPTWPSKRNVSPFHRGAVKLNELTCALLGLMLVSRVLVIYS